MSSLKSKKKKKQQQLAAAKAAASAMGASEEVPERGTRSRNQAISHGAITIQADLLELSKKRKSSSNLSKSRGGSKSTSKQSKNAPVAAIVSKKSGIEMKSTSILVQAHLSDTSKRVRFDLSSTVATCLKHIQKLDKDLVGGLFLQKGGIWLEEERLISSYALEEMEAVEVRPLPTDEEDLLTVRVMTPQDAAFDSITVSRKEATVRGILQSMKDKPSTFDLQSSSIFDQASGQWLETDASVADYDLENGAMLIYGERFQKKLSEASNSPSSSPLQNRKLDHPPLVSSMSEASLPMKSSAKPGRSSSTGKKFTRGMSSESVKFAAPRVKSSSGLAEITRAESSPSDSSMDDSASMVKKASFDDNSMPMRHPSDDCSPRMVDRSPVISRNRRAMSVSCDGNSRIARDAVVQQFTREDLSSGDGDKSTVTLNVLVAHAQKKIVVTINRTDTVASALEAIEAELGTAEPKCSLFHPRNMTKMDGADPMTKYELKDEDILVFKPINEKRSAADKKADRSSKGKGFFKRIRTSSKARESPAATAAAASSPSSPAAAPGPLVLDENIVKTFLQALTAVKAETEQGVFRISGNSAEIKELKESLRLVAAGIDLKGVDTHELTGCLKYYFREIEEPAVPYEFYDQILEAHDGSEVNLESLKAVISKLPETHRLSLAMMIKFLTTVIVHAESNLMSADNLGIVFGPTLIRNPGDSIDLGKTGALADLIVAMIENCDAIFDEDDTQYLDIDETDDSYDESGSSAFDTSHRDGDATSKDVHTTADDTEDDAGVDQEDEEGEGEREEGEESSKKEDASENENAEETAAEDEASVTEAVDEDAEEAGEADAGGDEEEPAGDDGETVAEPVVEVAEAVDEIEEKIAEEEVETEANPATEVEPANSEAEPTVSEEENAEAEDTQSGEAKEEENDREVPEASEEAAKDEGLSSESSERQDVAEDEGDAVNPVDARLDTAIFNLTMEPGKGSALLRDLLSDKEASTHLAETRTKEDLLELLRLVAGSCAQ